MLLVSDSGNDSLLDKNVNDILESFLLEPNLTEYLPPLINIVLILLTPQSSNKISLSSAFLISTASALLILLIVKVPVEGIVIV